MAKPPGQHRARYTCICTNCGETFKGKKRDTKWCYEQRCLQARDSARARKRYLAKKAAEKKDTENG